MTGTGNGCYVDVTVVKELLDVISSTENKHILGVFVGQDNKFCHFPGIVNLQRQSDCFIIWAGPQHKVQVCAYSKRFKSVCVSPQSDQSLSFPHEVMLDPLLPIEHPSKTLIRLCSLICVFDGHKCQLVSFVVHRLLLHDVKSVTSCINIDNTLVCYIFAKVMKWCS